MVEITHRHPLPCSCKTSSASTMSARGIGPVLSGHPEPHRLGIAANTASSHWNNADRRPLGRERPALEIKRRHPSSWPSRTSSAAALSTRGVGPVLSGHSGSHRRGLASTASSPWDGTGLLIEYALWESSSTDSLPCSSGTSSASTLSTRGIGPVSRQSGLHRPGTASEHSEPTSAR